MEDASTLAMILSYFVSTTLFKGYIVLWKANLW